MIVADDFGYYACLLPFSFLGVTIVAYTYEDV